MAGVSGSWSHLKQDPARPARLRTKGYDHPIATIRPGAEVEPVRLRHASLMLTFAVIVGTGWLNVDALADRDPPFAISRGYSSLPKSNPVPASRVFISSRARLIRSLRGILLSDIEQVWERG